MSEKNIAFLGTGNMNGAILRGVLASGFPMEDLRATSHSEHRAAMLREDLGIQAESVEENENANRDAAAWAEVVILGVKPKAITELCREIAPVLKEDAVVVSVAAGVTLETMERAFAEAGRPQQALVRCMPNTPAQLQMGVLSISPNSAATDAQTSKVASVLKAAGEVVRIEESKINALIAVSGSGPAYAFYLAEAMAKTGVELGLDVHTAAKIAALTLRGAGAMLGENPDAEALRKAVTSPQGTTDRAITTFDEQRVAEGIAAGQRACAARAAEMEEEFASQG